jgi:hypothetical protein
MPEEIMQGKRTVIEHQGKEFELPSQHTVGLKEIDNDGRPRRW